MQKQKEPQEKFIPTGEGNAMYLFYWLRFCVHFYYGKISLKVKTTLLSWWVRLELTLQGARTKIQSLITKD